MENGGSRRLWTKVLATPILVVFIYLLCSTYVSIFFPDIGDRLAIGTSERQMDRAGSLAGFGKLPKAREIALRVLAKEPLNQRALHILYQADSAAKREKYIPLLDRLGWRDDGTQIALIQAATQKNDYSSVARHADALLRRNRRMGEGFELMHALASEPAARAALVSRLALEPNWRSDFFRSYRPLNASDVAAQGLLIRALLRRNTPVHYSELVHSVNRSVDAGYTDQSFELWQAYYAANKRSFAGSATFPDKVESDENQLWGTYFDWNFEVADGRNFYLAGSGKDMALIVDWDGRGTPLLFWKLAQFPKKDWRLLVVSDGSTEDFSRLEFALRCDRRSPPFYLSFSTPEGAGSAISQTVPAGDVGCRFGRIEVYGATGAINQPIALALKDIRVVAADVTP